jgi:NAD(P)-dependent dehydrogenase (short-subunit alcohol dehydrogenase family)
MFSDEVVLVTGAGSGMGRAMAQEFTTAGATVAALDVNSQTALETVNGLGGDAMAVVADVRVRSEILRAVAEVLERYGRIDVLCNNAGILDGYADALNTDDDLWDDVIATNLTGPFLMARAVLPAMVDRGKGAIINTSSISGWVAGGGGTAYTSAKHGIIGLTKQLAYNYGQRGVRVNAICPGAVLTNMTKGLVEDEHVTSMIAQTLAGRWAQPEEIAGLAVYLASDRASFAHGGVYVMDGGWLVT